MKKLLAASALFALSACSSAPKVSSNPAEEAALQAKGKSVIEKGPTESAKAGGFNSVEFWQNRNKVANSFTTDVKPDILSKSKIVYLIDFKVRFNTFFGVGATGGHGMFDRASENVSGALGASKSVSVKEKKTVSKWVELNDAYMQKVTDEALAKFTADLKAAGYEVRTRDQMTYQPMKDYLATDKMVASPIEADRGAKIFAPTGWKLEKATANPGVGDAFAGFGDTLMKLAEQNSRKVTESLGMSVAYDVNLGTVAKSKEDPFVKVLSEVGFTTTYYTGAIRQNKAIKDGLPYKYSEALFKKDDNAGGKAIATAAAALMGTGGSYNTSEVYSVKPDMAHLTASLNEHMGYATEVLFERIRQGRDD